MRNKIFSNQKILSAAILVEIFCLIVIVLLSAYLLRMQHLGEENFRIASQLRYKSYLLSDQLRQSSDDLTRMVRSYAATGDSKFEEYYWNILDIRDGKKPRPINYDRVYWDFMTVKKPVAPFEMNGIASLESLMKETGFTEKEFQLLAEAKKESDKLVSLENIAMHAVKGEFLEDENYYFVSSDENFLIRGEPNQELARQIVFGDKYHEAKVRIMGPINEFLKSLDQRTRQNVTFSISQVKFYKWSLICSFFALILNGLLLLLTTNRHQKLLVDGLETSINQQSIELSERRKAEKALRSSETKYRELVEQSPIGLALCTMDGQLVSVNPAYAKILGRSVADTLKRSYWDVTPEKYAADEKRQLTMLEESGNYGPYEKEYLHKDGHLVPVRLNGMIVVRNDEKFIWSSVEDITALKKAEKETHKLSDQLRQSQKMEAIGTLAGGIAHDFNNILSAILGYSEMVKDEVPESSQAKKDIEEVLSAGNRAKELVQHILSFSRKSDEDRVPVAIHLVVEETIKLLRASIPATIEIQQDIDTDCGTILGNPTQLHQIVMNICTNAYQAMDDEGGILKVNLGRTTLFDNDFDKDSSMKPGEYVELTISDNGSGISNDHILRIFDPYFTTKEAGRGSGMGLAVVLGIVKSHDSMILVDSTPGKGTTFDIFFPVIEGEVKSESTTNGPLPTGKERVLIVDDEEDVIEVTKRRLEDLGYQVTAENDAPAALELFRSDPSLFDLVISDQTMPKLAGDQMAKAMLEIRPDMPIIICTGYSSRLDSDKADYLGISAFLMKPVDKRKLAHAIREVLDEY